MTYVRHDPDGSALWSRAQEAAQDGRRAIVLDTTVVGSRAEFLAVVQRCFALPDWFGSNWDALEESLGDLPDERITVLWIGASRWWHREPEQLTTALDIVAAVASTRAETGQGFDVVLLGAWPNELAP